MISPIKINKNKSPKLLLHFLPNEYDARELFRTADLSADEFSNYIQSIQFGGKFSKTTKPHRHVLSDKLIAKELGGRKEVVIIDVGASDGSTSIDLIKRMNQSFSKYYVTDVSFMLDVIETNGKSYFYDSTTRECIMIVSDHLITYHDAESSFPIGYIAKQFIKKAPVYDSKKVRKINLCQPELQRILKNDKRVILVEWSVLEPWRGEKADIIKAANVLKREVFSDDDIIKAIRNMKTILKEDGNILITKNLDVEKYSLFSMNHNEFKLTSELNGGCEISDLVMKA